MSRLLRAPLLHFLALGGGLLLLRGWWAPVEVVRPRIVMATEDVRRLREIWTDAHGAAPSGAAEAALVRDAIDEEILYREALARRFDSRDEAVRERLVRLGGFVGEESLADRDRQEREARRLGLERSDLVVRRHLVEMMRLAAGRDEAQDIPSEDELQGYLVRHAEEFALPGRVRLTQVYLSADARGEAAWGDALALLAELRESGLGAPGSRGDAFIRGADMDGSPAELERVFGAGFAEAVEDAPLDRWSGPIRSSYGVHLVWVHAREPGRVPTVAEVRGRLAHRWLRERNEQRAREAMEAMRARYEIVVEGR